VEASEDITFTTHSMRPESVVALAEDMFGQKAQAYTLAIRGYDFNDFGEALSERAAANLESAISFLEGVIQNNLYGDAASAIG
jgi:Ni,Fe-hydrogenase maturation factor